MTLMILGVSVPIIELVIGAIGIASIVGTAAAAMWFFIWGRDWILRLLESKGYPIVVPGWKTRMAEHPPFGATAQDVADMNAIILDHAVAAGYKKKDVTKKLNNGLVRWIKADPSLGGNIAVVDPFGRHVPVKVDGKIVYENGQPKTEPMYVAGWHTGNNIFVVYLPDSKIEDTAYTHEQGHEIHELKGLSDYDHVEPVMFGGKFEGKNIQGIVADARAEMRRRSSKQKQQVDESNTISAE